MNRGDVYWVNLDPAVGSEIRKLRPCVLISATPINQARGTVVVVPLSTAAKIRPPLTIEVSCINKQVAAVCDQIRTIDKSRLKNFIAPLSLKDLQNLEEGLRKVLVL